MCVIYLASKLKNNYIFINIGITSRLVSLADKARIVQSLRELTDDLSEIQLNTQQGIVTRKRRRPLHSGALGTADSAETEQQTVDMASNQACASSATKMETVPIATATPFVKGGKGYQCSLCDYSTASRGNIMKHCNIHANLRPFACNHCKKTFTSMSNLKAHMQRHSDELNFQCTDCSMVFNTSSDLSQHMRHHVRENAQLVGPCLLPGCIKPSTHFQNLSQHLLKDHNIVSRREYIARVQKDLSAVTYNWPE
jgi:Zinc finger, C2H2 type